MSTAPTNPTGGFVCSFARAAARSHIRLNGFLVPELSRVGAQFVVRRESEKWLSPIIGLITGMLTGATGVFVFPAVPYLGSLRLEKEELIQSIGISAFVCPLALG